MRGLLLSRMLLGLISESSLYEVKVFRSGGVGTIENGKADM